MSELRDLYQEVILDHYKKPRNRGRIEQADRRAEGHNPLCGDRLTIYVVMDGDVVRDVKFEGEGCAISTASASLMTQSVKGKAAAEARELFSRFHALVTGSGGSEGLDKLAVLAGVREFPVRVKCATLAWHTLSAALEGRGETVTTE